MEEAETIQELQFNRSYVINGDNFQGEVKWTW